RQHHCLFAVTRFTAAIWAYPRRGHLRMDVRLLARQCAGSRCFARFWVHWSAYLAGTRRLHFRLSEAAATAFQPAHFSPAHGLGRISLAQEPRSPCRLSHCGSVLHTLSGVLSIHPAAPPTSW